MVTTDRELREQRRLFYVGLTRARTSATLVSSDTAANERGYLMARSRFVKEMRERLAAVDDSEAAPWVGT